MNTRHVTGIAVAAACGLALAAVGGAQPVRSDHETTAAGFADIVRQATAQFGTVEQAMSAGYGLFHGCVSGPEEGAMGVHYVNMALAGDGALDADHPEALIYEPSHLRLQLVGVEYIVFADAWQASHTDPPVLVGQVFQYVGSPNRYNLPAFYELHVWAWKNNPNGLFADWNPRVSCAGYTADGPIGGGHHR